MSYRTKMSLGATLAFGLGGLVFAAPAASGKPPIIVSAPQPEEVVVRRISYADLNLATAPGERTLNSRVRSGVTDLCNEVVGNVGTPITKLGELDRCNNSAWDQARPQIANAVQRAREIAATGTSSLTAAVITFSIPE